MIGKGRRLIISDAMTESGPVRGALWMFKADGKGKKRKVESKSKELSGEKKRRKLDSESTEKKEATVDGGENDSEIAELLVPWTENHLSSFKCGFLNILSRQNLLRSLLRLLFLLRSNKNGAKKCLENHIPFDL